MTDDRESGHARSVRDRVCAQCGRTVAMMCQVGTLFCCMDCRSEHLRAWASATRNP